MSKHSAENIRIFKLGLQQFAKKQVEEDIMKICVNVANKMVRFIEGSFNSGSKQYPVWTANLRDSTGVGVYRDSVLQRFVPVSIATRPQKGVWGSQLLSNALQYGSQEYSKGIWLVLFSTTPYAYYIDKNGSKRKRGQGYFKSLSDIIYADVLSELRQRRL